MIITWLSCDLLQFMQDAQEVMDMLVKVQNDQGDMEPDDPQVYVYVAPV